MLRWLDTGDRTNCEICHKEFIFIENNKTRCFICFKKLCFAYMIYFFVFTFLYLGFVRYNKNDHNTERIFLNIHLINVLFGVVILLLYNVVKHNCEMGNRVIYIEPDV